MIEAPVAAFEAERISSPIAEAAAHLSFSVAGDAGVSALPLPIAPTASASLLAAAPEERSGSAVAEASHTEPEAVAGPEPEKAESKLVPSAPWWLTESIRDPEPVRPPLPQQPEKMWTARRPSTDALIQAAAQSLNVEPQKFKEALEQWRSGLPGTQETARAASPPRPGEAPKSDLEEANGNMNSRLNALKNFLSVLGAKDGQRGEESGEHHNGGPSVASRSEWTIPQDGASSAGRASPRTATASAEFVSPEPPVAEFERGDGRLGEPSAHRDGRALADVVEILSSKLGQYERL
jgi:hypothetical protein